MVVEPQQPPLYDPLTKIRGLAQFPNSIRVSTDSNALDSIHHLVKSKGAKNPEKVLEEAKKIVDGGSELLNSEYVAFTSSMGIGEASPRKENVNPQERRPGFGRRRAKFSIKPNLSQPPVSLVTSFDMAKFPDPEEFFAEYEKHENAQKEIERQMGGCVTSSIDEDIFPQNAMKKRPGILGDSRKRVSYRHRYAQLISEVKEGLEPSPEPKELTVLKSSNSNSTQRNSDVEVEPQDNDPAGFTTKTEHEVNMILDELLSTNNEDLDDYGALSLLQKRLDIKPVDLDILSIPNFEDTEKIDFVALGKNLPKPQRSSFTVERFKQVTPLSDKQMGRSANSSLESSTPRNLLGSLSSLRRRVIQSNPLGDLFSPCNIDLPSPRNILPDEGSEPTNPKKGLGERSTKGSLAGVSPLKTPSRQSSHIDVAQNISPMNFLVPDDGNDMDGKMDHISTDNAGDHKHVDGSAQGKENIENAASMRGSLAGVSPLKTPSRQSSHIDVAQNISPMNFLVPDDGNDIDGKMDHISTDNAGDHNLVDGSAQGKENIENAPSMRGSLAGVSPLKTPSRQSSHIDVAQNISPMNFLVPDDGNDIDGKMDHISTDNAGDHNLVDGSAQGKENIENAPSLVMPSSEGLERTNNDWDNFPIGNHEPSQTGESKLPSKGQEHKKRRTAVGISERKNLSKRKSILDGGTTFVSGLRRSKRIKTRPLEYWKGERLIYSRVNDSIKLTGFTYISPSKNSGMLKVKSFI